MKRRYRKANLAILKPVSVCLVLGFLSVLISKNSYANRFSPQGKVFNERFSKRFAAPSRLSQHSSRVRPQWLLVDEFKSSQFKRLKLNVNHKTMGISYYSAIPTRVGTVLNYHNELLPKMRGLGAPGMLLEHLIEKYPKTRWIPSQLGGANYLSILKATYLNTKTFQRTVNKNPRSMSDRERIALRNNVLKGWMATHSAKIRERAGFASVDRIVLDPMVSGAERYQRVFVSVGRGKAKIEPPQVIVVRRNLRKRIVETYRIESSGTWRAVSNNEASIPGFYPTSYSPMSERF